MSTTTGVGVAGAPSSSDHHRHHHYRSSSSSTKLPPPLPETTLLRGVLCALQGVDSDVLRFDEGTDSFSLTPAAAMATPRASASLVLQLAEVGWLHRRVREAAEKGTSSSSSEGAVSRAFRAALRRELMPVLEASARLDDALNSTTEGKRRPSVASVAAAASDGDPLSSLLSSPAFLGLGSDETDENAESQGDESIGNNYLTLRRAAALFLPLRERLLSLALAAEVAEAAPTHALPLCLAALAERELGGVGVAPSENESDTRDSASVASRLSSAAAAPALAALWSWALDGALPGGGSGSKEGFARGDCAVRVASSPASAARNGNSGALLWRHAFSLDAEAVPPCLWELSSSEAVSGGRGGTSSGGGGGSFAALAAAAVASASGTTLKKRNGPSLLSASAAAPPAAEAAFRAGKGVLWLRSCSPSPSSPSAAGDESDGNPSPSWDASEERARLARRAALLPPWDGAAHAALFHRAASCVDRRVMEALVGRRALSGSGSKARAAPCPPFAALSSLSTMLVPPPPPSLCRSAEGLGRAQAAVECVRRYALCGSGTFARELVEALGGGGGSGGGGVETFCSSAGSGDKGNISRFSSIPSSSSPSSLLSARASDVAELDLAAALDDALRCSGEEGVLEGLLSAAAGVSISPPSSFRQQQQQLQPRPRLRAKLDRSASSASLPAWEGFHLRLELPSSSSGNGRSTDVEAPLATLLTPATLRLCGEASKLLWCLARTEASLSEAARDLAGAWDAVSAVSAVERGRRRSRRRNKEGRKNDGSSDRTCSSFAAGAPFPASSPPSHHPALALLSRELRALSALRSRAAAAVYALRTGASLCGVDDSFARIRAALEAAPDLDSLIGAHEQCLDEMATALAVSEEEEGEGAGRRQISTSTSAVLSSSSVSSALRSLLASARAVRRPCSALRVAAVEAAASSSAFDEDEGGSGVNSDDDDTLFDSLFSPSCPLACTLTEVSSDRRSCESSLRARCGALADALTESEERGGRRRRGRGRRGGDDDSDDSDDEQEDGIVFYSSLSSDRGGGGGYRWVGCAFEGARAVLEEGRQQQ